MSRPRRSSIDIGEAISIESALTVMVVLILIRLCFFIPLVNIDRAHLEKAQHDQYWNRVASYIRSQEADGSAAHPYVHAFGLDGDRISVKEDGAIHWVTALSTSGDITVIRQEGEKYILLTVANQSTTPTYQFGDIHWSGSESEWFTAGNTLDYGDSPISKNMQSDFRTWTKESAGF